MALDLHVTSIKNKIDNAIEVTNSFMSSIASDSIWFMNSGQLKSAFKQLNEIKMSAQMQILANMNQN